MNERKRRYAVPKSEKGTYKDLIGHGGSVIDRKVGILYNDFLFVTHVIYRHDGLLGWNKQCNFE